MILPIDWDDKYQEVDILQKRQEMLARYRRLKQIEKSQLILEDELFLENFELL